MSEKHLTEAPWKAITVKQKLKDPGLGKALASFETCEEKDHTARLKALDTVEKHAEALKKEHKDKKEIADYLGELLKESAKSRKPLELAAKADKNGKDKEKDGKDPKGGKDGKDPKDSKEDDEEEDEETLALKKDLKNKLTSALAQVKSRAPGEPEPGEEGQPQLAFMAYLAGAHSAVIVAKKVSGGTKKLLTSIAGGATGGTYCQGECIYEKSAHTFVLDKVPGGLASKIAKALVTETGQKYKVRVRSTDGLTELDSDTDKDPDEPGAKVETPDPTKSTETPETTESESTEKTETVDLAGKWKEVKMGLYPKIKDALAGTPANRSEIVRMVGVATGFEKAGNFQGAIDTFGELEPLLSGEAPSSTDPTPSPADLAAAFKARLQGLLPEYQAALKAGGPNRDILDMAMKLAAAAAKSQDYEQANLQLDKVEAALKPAPQPETKSEPADLVALFKQRAQAFAPGFKAALLRAQSLDKPLAEEMDAFYAQMFDEAKKKDFEKALATLDILEGLVKRVPNPNIPTPPPPPGSKQPVINPEELQAEPQTPADRWNAARTPIQGKLQAEIKEIVATKDPDAGGAELELRAVLRQIGGEMDSQKKADDMLKYLQDDEIVANVCELAFDLRTPLIKVLNEIRSELAA